MRILEFAGLDVSRVKVAYRRVAECLTRDDFHGAQVKKLEGPMHGKFYRAKLNDSDRLLFSLVKYDGATCALMLEVIANHAYESSRFLRGVVIDEAKILNVEVNEAALLALPLRYLHPERSIMHWLDKPISFDDAQVAIFAARPPLIIVGSAGSGKTALILEKLKQVEGEVLYVTHSAYLAQNARNIYFGYGFEQG